MKHCESVIEAIGAQAARTPDAIALVRGGRHVTFAGLLQRARRWASALREAGVGPEMVVAIRLPESEEFVAAMLAVMGAGGAYLPLDVSAPPARCSAIVSASGAMLVIADGDAVAGVRRLSVADLDRFAGSVGGLSRPVDQQLAYVLYTSGSTGAPKGVAVAHGALSNHMAWMANRFGFAAERLVQRTSCAFDASVWELILSLLTGGTLFLAGNDEHRDPSALRDLVRRENATALQCVPTFLGFALERGLLDGTSLQVLFVGGEQLTDNLAAAVRGVSDAAIVNLYGPTETTIDATWFELGAPGRGGAVSIGRPIVNVWAEPISPSYDSAADGELWIGGAGVARGYHRQPSLTAEAFVPAPGPTGRGARAYRTGDQVRREHGLLTFVGRADRLVKLNGFRIELAEIEVVLRQHPLVRDAIVRVHDAADGRALVAYCLPSEGASDAEAVRSYVAERLPHYMVPTRVVWLPRFPMKPNGKVDLDQLQLPATAASRGAGVVPQTDAERVLVEVWGTLFKRPVGVTDNFFELGGDSIRSIQLISLAKTRGLTLKLQDVFLHPTVRELAARIPATAAPTPTVAPFALLSDHDRAALDSAGLDDAYPTTVLLDTLFFLSQTSPRYEVYVTSCDLLADWDEESFGAALRRIVDRHPWLRTSFAFHGFSRRLQLVHTNVPVRWTVEDLSLLSAAEQDERIRTWCDREKHRPFDWSTAPTWRVTVHLRGRDRFQLTLSEPIFDGWSVSSFLGELLKDYSAARAGQPAAPRSGPTALYRDFVAAEQAAVSDAASIAFWRGKLAGDFGGVLPRACDQRKEHAGVRRVEIRLPADVSERLRTVARELSVPLKSVLLAAHARVLATLIGAPTVVSGVIMNGRADVAETERVLGLHINTVPLVLRVAGARSWRDLIRRVFDAEREALPHRRFPLAAIQRLHGGRPAFEAAFNFTHFHGLADAVRDAGVKILDYLAWDQTFFPLTAQFHVDVRDATIGLGLDYDSEELAAAQIEEIAGLYRSALQQIASDSTQSCKTLRSGPVVAASPAATRTPRYAEHVLDAFWRVARRRPDAVALTRGDDQISFEHLERAASALAVRLERIGVADRGVIVCAETQYEAAIALLAVLEAGGIYVPVDPSFPTARIAGLARSASAAACVCDPASAEALRAMAMPLLIVEPRDLARSADPDGRVRPLPGSAAYRIYTSGSTGAPKGVEVGHEALAHFLHAIQSVARVTPADVVAGTTTIAFDISLLELLLPLTTGARLVAIEREVCRDGTRLAARLCLAEITVCQGTPTMWRMLLASGERLPRGLATLSGGEALSADLAARLLGEGLDLTNAYGPTETTIWSATGRVTGRDRITLGEPLGATSWRLADAFDEEPPLGAAGEIRIGGPGLAHGYVGEPALSAERFVPVPQGFGTRCYRTGDLGRRTSEGGIEFLGRRDEQVKVRGYRIELAEIENALRACPGIRDAIVRVVGDDAAALAAYVIPSDGAPCDVDDVKTQLRRVLPEYMIPRHVVAMASFPLTANHKVDRSRLPVTPVAQRAGQRVLELFQQVKAMSPDQVKRGLAEG